MPEQLIFDVDDKVVDAIAQGTQVANKFTNDLSVICPIFDKVGKVEMKQCKVITCSCPCFFAFFLNPPFSKIIAVKLWLFKTV